MAKGNAKVKVKRRQEHEIRVDRWQSTYDVEVFFYRALAKVMVGKMDGSILWINI